MLKKMLLVIVLSVFMSCCLITNCMATDEAKTTIIIPDKMTYEGNLNPRDAIDITKYKAVIVEQVGPIAFLFFAKATNKDANIQYIAYMVVGGKLVGVTCYENGEFKLVSIRDLNSTKFEIIERTHQHFLNYQEDFQNVFGVPFPIREGL